MKLATRLLIFALGLGMVLLTPGTMLVDKHLREVMFAERAASLERDAKLIGSHWSIERQPQEIAESAAATLGGRVTLVDRSGIVVGDAAVGQLKAGSLGRTAIRPEISAARSDRTGVAVERDAEDQALYVAARTPDGIVRVGVETAALAQVFDSARRGIATAGLAVILVAVLFAMLYARYVSKPVIQLRDMAQALSRSEFSESPPVDAPGEVGDLAESLAHLSARLQALEEVRRDFIANVSHELCSPLTIASGFAATLARHDPPAEERRQFARAILANTERIQRIIDDMLDLSRIETGRWIPRPESVPIPEIAREVIDSLRASADQKNVELLTDFHPQSTVIDADRTAVRQTLANLTENAIRHTDSGTVTIFAERTSDGFWLGVQDTGEGIDASSLPRIFERLYRVDIGRARQAGGSGLGLAIVKHMAEAHGGKVDAESEPGIGTTIRVFFPQPVGRPRGLTPARGVSRLSDPSRIPA